MKKLQTTITFDREQSSD